MAEVNEIIKKLLQGEAVKVNDTDMYLPEGKYVYSEVVRMVVSAMGVQHG